MGGKGGAPTIGPSKMDKTQAKILEELEATVGKPVRQVVMPPALQTLGGPGVFQTSLPAPDRQVIEDQYKQAQNSIMNTGTRGGQLQSQLATLDRDRAATVSGATNEATQRGIERSLGMVGAAIPSYGQQMSARSDIGNRDTERRAANAKAQYAANQQMGSNIGGLVGLIPGLFK